MLKELLPRISAPLLEACHVDLLIVRLEAAVEQLQAAQTAQRKAATEAAQRNLLKAMEPIRDVLQLALQGDKADLVAIFGGAASERVWRVKRVLGVANPSLSQTHASDMRWQHLEVAILSVQQVLSELGKFRPAIESRIRHKATSDLTDLRMPAMGTTSSCPAERRLTEEDSPTASLSDHESMRLRICEELQGEDAFLDTFFMTDGGDLLPSVDEALAEGEGVGGELVDGVRSDVGPPSMPRPAPKAKLFLLSFARERQIGGVVWYPLRLLDTVGERFFLKRFNDFRLLDRALREDMPEWLVMPELPDAWRVGLMGGFGRPHVHPLQEYLERLLAQVDSLEALPELDLFLGVDASDRVFKDNASHNKAAGQEQLMTLSEFLG